MAHLRILLRHRLNLIANLLIISKLSIDVYLYKRGDRLRNGMKRRSPRMGMGMGMK